MSLPIEIPREMVSFILFFWCFWWYLYRCDIRRGFTKFALTGDDRMRALNSSCIGWSFCSLVALLLFVEIIGGGL